MAISQRRKNTMRRIRVREYGKNVYKVTLQDEKTITERGEYYSKYLGYFRQLLAVAPKNTTFVLEITKVETLMTLYLNKNQMQHAESIKRKLLKFEEVEQVGFEPKEFGLAINIMDIFWGYRG